METPSAFAITSSSSRFNSGRLAKTTTAALAAVVLVAKSGVAAPFGGEPPWIARNDVPLPSGIESVEIVRADEPLFQGPDARLPRRGTAALAARLPVYGAVRRSDCVGRWFMVGALAWVCEANVRLSRAAALPAGSSQRTRDGLPHRYYFVGRDGSLGYTNLGFAEEGVPDAEFEPGFAVAIVATAERARDPFGLTAHGFWLPLRDLSAARAPSFHGTELAPGQKLGFVFTDGARGYRAPNAGELRGERLTRFSPVELREARSAAGRSWYRDGAGTWRSDRDVRVASPAALPLGLEPQERWIDVDLKNQILTAFVGDSAVFTTLISSGKGREGSESATPKGVHRIWVKLESTDMDNLEDEEAQRYYAMQSVPWVMFFKKGYGLHGTYWHDSFGRTRSHGCVNLAPLDAARLFEFTSPRLPAGWTAVFPTEYEPGTMIRIR